MTISWFGTPAEVVRFDEFTVHPVGDGPPKVYFIRKPARIAGVTSDGVLVDAESQPIPDSLGGPWTPEEEAEIEALRQGYIQSMSCDPEEE